MSKGLVGKPLCVSWLFETLKVKRVALRSGRTATFVKGVEPHKAARWIGDVGMMFHDLASNSTPFQPSWSVLRLVLGVLKEQSLSITVYEGDLGGIQPQFSVLFSTTQREIDAVHVNHSV